MTDNPAHFTLSSPSKALPARERLLISAQRLLWEHGYEAMSPRMVLEDSGVGQGSLYHHFKTKKDLAHAALDGIATMLIERALAILANEDLPPLERIKAWLTIPRDSMKGCRVGRLASEQAILDDALGGPVARYFTVLQQTLADVLRQAKDEGDLPADFAEDDCAALLVAAVQGGYTLSRATGQPEALGQAVRAAVAMMCVFSTKRS